MKKELDRALRPFRIRLTIEGILRAASISGVFVLPVWLLLALVRQVFGVGGERLSVWMLLVWFVLFAALYVWRYRIAGKKAAHRLDALCGLDRVATAMEFSENDGVLCRMQREDAARRLAAINPKELRISLPVPAMAASLILAGAIAAVPCMPQSMTESIRGFAMEAIPGLEQQESEEIIALRQMIEALHAEVEASDIKEADKTKLLNRLDEISDRLNAGFVEISALQEIHDAMDGMLETVKELTPRDTYMAAMIEFESLRFLGEAIYDQNMDVVIMILESIGRQLHEKKGMEQVDALMSLAYDVNASLAKPLRDNSQDQLRQGMMAFAAGLESAAQMVYNGRDNANIIDMSLETIETYIRDYLGVPEEGERYDPFADRVYEQPSQTGSGTAIGKAAPQEKQLSPAETEYVYDPPKALKASQYVPGALNEQGEKQKIKAEQRERATGTVPYGEVYGDYYAEYLRTLNDEMFPQELRVTAEAYMNGL